jgi:UDP-N-acetylglucosamine 2-epimerase (non-hydrolysing)
VTARPRVMVVIGTRPEAVKMAPVVEAFRDRSEAVECRVVLTGQHTAMVDRVLELLQVPVDRSLGIMREGQTLYDVGAGVLTGLRDVVREEDPAMILVQGDTASVFFASLVAFFERVPVGHVEAGLRTGNRWSPFPEEMFRRLTDHAAELHFAPTRRAVEALHAEGIGPEGVHLTGNTVVDALLRIARQGGPPEDPALAALLEPGAGRLALLTAHRRESFGEPLEGVFHAVRTLVDRHPELTVLFPVHPNPQVTEPAARILGGHPRLRLFPPLDYPDLVRVLSRADLVLTDSGGIQEEAPTFGVPVLVLRAVTERPEALEAGSAVRVGTEPAAILEAAERALAGRGSPRQGAPLLHPSPFGDGRAGARIADLVVHHLTGRPRITEDWS